MKQIISFMVAIVTIISCSTATFASASNEDISLLVNYDITVTYNGKIQFFQDANGKSVYPLSYNDTTYLPVRAVSEMLGLGVQWNQEAQAITLTSGAEIKSNENGTGPSTASYTAGAVLDKIIAVMFDGNAQSFYDANNVQVYPISFNDTTYLPIRALSKMLNVPVEWIQSEQRVALGVGEYIPELPPVSNNYTDLLQYAYEIKNDVPEFYYKELSVETVNGEKVICATGVPRAELWNYEAIVFEVNGYNYMDFTIRNNGKTQADIVVQSRDNSVEVYEVMPGESVNVMDDYMISSGVVKIHVSIYQRHANAMDVTLSDFNLHN